ncbi:MAG: hypothetical protein AB7O21_18380 [Gammaproteobacteria bacterium]
MTFPTTRRRNWRRHLCLLCATVLSGLVTAAPPPKAPPVPALPVIPQAASIGEWFTAGRPLLGVRLRYEHADDALRFEAADALSLRTALGFRTASLHGVFALAEIESVLAVGDYDDGGANRGEAPRLSLIADPEGTELNQAYVGFDGLPSTVVQVGRQVITDREAPLHRHVGNVVWRQNWQTFDAVGAVNAALPDTIVRAWYTWNVNRIFGEDHPVRGFDDKALDGYLLNVVHTGLPWGRLELYAYLLDFERSTVRAIRSFYPSTQTYGGRLDGAAALSPRSDFLYVAEVAHQGDFAGNPTGDIDQFFGWGSLGMTHRPHRWVQTLTARISHEHLGGDGGADRFTTPLATGHAFQGWADRFLNTPGDGVEDTYVTFQSGVSGFTLTVMYHWFASDRDHYAYGEELDWMLTKPVHPHCTVGLKYADYAADGNARNRVRNAATGQAADMRNLWLWLEFQL